jgi:hypothetical protein
LRAIDPSGDQTLREGRMAQCPRAGFLLSARENPAKLSDFPDFINRVTRYCRSQ